MVKTTTTGIGSDQTQTYTTTWTCSCSHFLPCGLCDISNKQCPKSGVPYVGYPNAQPNPYVSWYKTNNEVST